MTINPYLRFGLLLALAIVVVDQLSKLWVLQGLGFSPEGCLQAGIACGRIEVSGVFDLTMVWNHGVSFGLLKAGSALERWGLVVLSVVISGFFLMWLRTAPRRVTATALGLVIGGAIGNMIDRARFGAVVDFLDFSGIWRPYFFNYVFNVADAAITVGACLLVLDYLRHGEEPDRPKTAA